MTGLERNADVVQMSSYAPLSGARGCLAMDAQSDLVRQPALVRHAELLRAAVVRRQPWQPCPSHHHQRQRDRWRRGDYASAASGTAPGTIVVKLVNPGPVSRTVRFTFPAGLAASAGMMAAVLTGEPDAENTLGANPKVVAPADDLRRQPARA